MCFIHLLLSGVGERKDKHDKRKQSIALKYNSGPIFTSVNVFQSFPRMDVREMKAVREVGTLR
jgi:hypothetical protein